MAHYSQLHPECVDWEATSAAMDCLRASKRSREGLEQAEGDGEELPRTKRPRLEDGSGKQEGAAKIKLPVVLFTGTQTASCMYCIDDVAQQRHLLSIYNTR